MQSTMIEQFGILSQFVPMVGGMPERPMALESKSAAPVFHVVILEGSDSLARLLATGLKADSLDVEVAPGLADAYSLLGRRATNLLILDLDLPDCKGLSVLGDLRTRYPDVAILVLSGRNGVDGLVSALDHGADDYLQKPFSLLELMARVRALRRRSSGSVPKPASRAGKLLLDREQCRVERDGRMIDLTPREFALLEYLVQNAGKTLSRAQLSQAVWNMSVETNTNIVDVYIKYLRDKLDGEYDDKLIRTVRGMGYIFQPQV